MGKAYIKTALFLFLLILLFQVINDINSTMKKKSAREFYYKHYEKDTMEVSIQQRYPWHFNEKIKKYVPDIDDLKDQLLSFEPNFSNDYKIESLVREMLANLTKEVCEILEKCFFVTHYDKRFQAFVKRHQDEFEGEIIFFNLGLSMAIYEYSRLLAWEIIRDTFYSNDDINIIRSLFPENSDLNSIGEELDRGMELQAIKLKKWQRNWSENGFIEIIPNEDNFISYHTSPECVQNAAILYSMYSHKFIIGHELAHYLLGHLGR